MYLALIIQWNVSPFAILNQFQMFLVVIISEDKEYEARSVFQYVSQEPR